jgi:3-hydroxyisobutyrate dehydrogenase-like beta-hydroxyacid dehydrogenase
VKVLKENTGIRTTPLYYLDLNAVSPRSAREIADLFQDPSLVIPIDGGIIGGAPKLKTDTTATTTMSRNADSASDWYRPSIPQSGPHRLTDSPKSGQHLAELLKVRHISDEIGQASGLKMCFAATTKGFMALVIQSFTTASQLGVLDELKKEMGQLTPAALQNAERGIPGVPPKAYRWVREMEEIAATFSEEGGFDKDVFTGISKVYKTMADDTVLGLEKTGHRNRGTTADDVALAMGEGLQAVKKKSE